MPDDVIARVRSANPVPPPLEAIDAADLFASIIADTATGSASAAGRSRRQRRWVAPAVGGAAAAGAALAAGTATGILAPEALFKQDPAQRGQPVHRMIAAIPGTAREVTSLTVPGVGRIGIWAAKGTDDSTCLAARNPDGSWVAGPGSRLGGTVPGCSPNRIVNRDVLNDDGFDWREADFFMTAGKPSGYRVFYGVIEDWWPQTAVRIVDRRSGLHAPVIDHRYYAIAVFDRDGQHADFAPTAYDVQGRVIATTPTAGTGDSVAQPAATAARTMPIPSLATDPDMRNTTTNSSGG